MNKNGVSMPSIRLRGRTVDLHVVNNAIRLASCEPEDFVKALNYFPPDSRVTMNDHTFVSKFHSSGRAVYDCVNRSFSLRTYGKKDLKGIYGLMTSLGDNNGKLYEPVIARYVYTSYNMPRHRQLVGYFDLGEYMAVIKDPRRSFFPNVSEKTKTRKEPFLKVAPRDRNTSELVGLVSTNSFSFRKKVGISIHTVAKTARTMKQMR